MIFDINLTTFTLGTAFILIMPGPTNTLLATAGLTQGARRALPLIAFELAGYLIAISAWGLFLVPAQHHYPWIAMLVRIGASCYLIYLAAKMWHTTPTPQATGQRAIGPGTLFTATLLNPKGLLFASAIFPAHTFDSLQDYLPVMAVFSCLLIPIGILWTKFGAALGKGHLPGINPRKLQRASALLIGAFSVSIAWAAFH